MNTKIICKACNPIGGLSDAAKLAEIGKIISGK